MKAPDAATLVVTLAHPTAYFPGVDLVPDARAGAAGDDQKVRAELDQAGEYGEQRALHAERMAAQRLYLSGGESLTTGDLVGVKRIKVLPVNNPTACFNLFYSRKTDLILDTRSIPSTLVQDIKDKPYFHANPFGATSFVRFNVKRKPFSTMCGCARRWRWHSTRRTS